MNHWFRVHCTRNGPPCRGSRRAKRIAVSGFSPKRIALSGFNLKKAPTQKPRDQRMGADPRTGSQKVKSEMARCENHCVLKRYRHRCHCSLSYRRGPFESNGRKQLSPSSCGWALILSGQFRITRRPIFALFCRPRRCSLVPCRWSACLAQSRHVLLHGFASVSRFKVSVCPRPKGGRRVSDQRPPTP